MSRSVTDVTSAPRHGESMLFTISVRGDTSPVVEAVEDHGGDVLEEGRFNQLDVRLQEVDVPEIQDMDAVDAISAEGPLRFAEESYEGNW